MARVLIVDDSSEKANSIKTFTLASLADSDINVDVACSVSAALKCCTTHRYDLVVLDMFLPFRDGCDPERNGGIRFLSSMLEQRVVKRPINLIGLTAYSEIKNEMSDYFHKYCYTIVSYSAGSDDWQLPLGNIINRIEERGKVTAEVGERSHGHWTLYMGLGLFILLLVVVELFTPYVITNTIRVLLFLSASVLLGLVIGAEVKTKFTMRIPGFVFTTTGVAAVVFGGLLMQQYLLDDGSRVGVYQVSSENGESTQLSDYVVEASIDAIGARPEIYVKGDQFLLVYPKGVESARVSFISKDGARYTRVVKYSASKMQVLKLHGR